LKKEIKLPNGGSVSGEDLVEIPLDNWLARAEALFGKDKKNWKFKCPNCGHIQSVGDFVELNKLGISDVEPDGVAYFSCIGRYDTRIKQPGTIFKDKKGSPCNYTLGGLFCFAKTFVIDSEEKRHPVFEFAEVDTNEKM
jgi:hypothetical protein